MYLPKSVEGLVPQLKKGVIILITLIDCIGVEKDNLSSDFINTHKKNRYIIDMLDAVRDSSVKDEIDEDQYVERLFGLEDTINDINNVFLVDEDLLTSKQLEKQKLFRPWIHQGSDGLRNFEEGVYPTSDYELRDVILGYLQKSYLHTDFISRILTDASIYTETASLKTFTDPFQDSTKWSLIFVFVRLAIAIAAGLILEGTWLLLFGIAFLAHTYSKPFISKVKEPRGLQFKSLIKVYDHCSPEYYNAKVLFKMIDKIRDDEGVRLPSCLYELLELQVRSK